MTRRPVGNKKTKAWFLNNIILPNNEIIDKPGYVVSKYAGKGTRCYVREVFVPELVLSEIEDNAIRSFGKRGKRALYAAGKQWGVRYGLTTNLPKKSAMGKEDFQGFVDSFVKFLGSEYADSIKFKLDYDRDRIETEYSGLMICRLNGLGYFLLGTLNGA